MTQRTIWNTLGMIGLTPWTQGSFFYFMSLCFLATSRNTGCMDIHEIFRIWTQGATYYTVSRLSRLYHALQTRHGGGLRSRSASCLVMFFSARPTQLVRKERGLDWDSWSQSGNGSIHTSIKYDIAANEEGIEMNLTEHFDQDASVINYIYAYVYK